MTFSCQLPTVFSLAFVLVLLSAPPAALADPPAPAEKLQIISHHPLTMTVNTRQPVILPVKAPRVYVQDPSILTVTAESPQQLMVIARQAGTTQLFIWESANAVRTLEITVLAHSQILQNVLSQHFPELAVEVHDIRGGVTLMGTVASQAVVDQVGALARRHVPLVINKLTVTPAAVIILHTQIIEISSADAESAGLPSLRLAQQDRLTAADHTQITHTAATPLTRESVRVGLVDADNPFHNALARLLETGVARVIAQPVLATVSGTPATYNSGGKYPVVLPQKSGPASLQYEPFGLQLKITPLSSDPAAIQIRVQPEIIEVPTSARMQYEDVAIPAFRTRAADATMRLKSGQTLVLQGMPQGRTRSSQTGLPVLKDIPLVGPAFQATVDQAYNVELLILVRPEIRSTTPARVADKPPF